MIKRIWKSIRRTWSAFTQTGTGGLIQHGDWRCVYDEDGKHTFWMSHGDAANLAYIFGGHLEWRYDEEANYE